MRASLGLADRLDLTNTTFRRHFPELASEITHTRSTPAASAHDDAQPSPYDVLVARNAKLRRANRTLTDNLQLAVAHIQRLGVDNARLHDALEASSNNTHIDRPDRPHRRDRRPRRTTGRRCDLGRGHIRHGHALVALPG